MFDLWVGPAKLAAQEHDGTLRRSMAMGAATGMIGKVIGFPADLRQELKKGLLQTPAPHRGTHPRGRGAPRSLRRAQASRRALGRAGRHFWGIQPGHRVQKGRAVNAILLSELLGAAAKGTVYIPVYELLQRRFPPKKALQKGAGLDLPGRVCALRQRGA